MSYQHDLIYIFYISLNTIFRVSPERLFLDLTFYSESVLVEKLGIGLGLDVNTLYEKSAEYLLQRGQVAQAVKFCKFVKVMKSITVHCIYFWWLFVWIWHKILKDIWTLRCFMLKNLYMYIFFWLDGCLV